MKATLNWTISGEEHRTSVTKQMVKNFAERGSPLEDSCCNCRERSGAMDDPDGALAHASQAKKGGRCVSRLDMQGVGISFFDLSGYGCVL